MLDKVRNRLNELINISNDIDELEKYKVIKKLLDNDDCFKEIDANTAINILIDLKFDEENAKKIYGSLIN